MKNKLKILLISLMVICSVFAMTLSVGCAGTPSKNNGPFRESTLSISNFEIRIEKGNTAQLFAGYDNVTEISFVSSDENIATVTSSSYGVANITAVNTGVTYVKISVATQTKTCKIIVYVSDYVIEFDRTESDTKVWVGTGLFINATVKVDGKASNNVVAWSVVSGSCDMNVNGNYAVFTPTQAGNVTIKAVFENKAEKLFSFNAVSSAS